jgi:DNA-binding transcriptional MerR regulator
MVRKRTPWDRRNDRRRKRLKTPAPTTGWVASELAALTQMSYWGIRYYLKRGLISRPPFRGTATRYQRSQLLRLLAIQRLRAERGVTLDEIRNRLDSMSEPELVALVSAGGLSEAQAAALEVSAPARLEHPLGPSRDGSDLSSGRWLSLPLLPGLELRFDPTASPLVQQLVRQIQADGTGERQ